MRTERKLTRKERVLKLLQDESPHWVAASIICRPEIGGSEGLRRLRELRADGHIIEMKKLPERASRSYRLLPGRHDSPTLF